MVTIHLPAFGLLGLLQGPGQQPGVSRFSGGGSEMGEEGERGHPPAAGGAARAAVRAGYVRERCSCHSVTAKISLFSLSVADFTFFRRMK